jgi:hypothetical protein
MKLLKANVPYAYVIVGAIWLAVAVVSDTPLLLWPIVACVAGGALLKVRPTHRFTWAWTTAAAVMGFLLAAYQAYAAVPMIGGAFTILAIASLVAFAVFALGHLLLLYAESIGSAK